MFTWCSTLTLTFSVLASACTSAQTGWDWDFDEGKRPENPFFYGYIADGFIRQILTIAEMIAISVFNLVVRSLSCIIIAQKSGVTLVAVLCGEMALFFIYKGLRNDLPYCLPIYGILRVVSMFVGRLMAKILADCERLRGAKRRCTRW